MSIYQRLDAWIDQHFDEQVQFLQALVRVPTDTPPGNNAPHAERTAELIKDYGFDAEKHAVPEADVKVIVTRGRPAFNAGEGGKKLVDKAVAYYKEAGGTLGVEERTGGGTDAAYAALSGKPVIESLGLPGFGYHSDKAEYVDISAIPRRLYMAARLIMDLGAGK